MKNLILKKIEFSGIAPYVWLWLYLVGVKIFIVLTYGNSTPYWDQWDSEAAFLFKPFFNGTLDFANLFLPHSEHRIFTTRLFSLLLLKINGNVWSPLLEMLINSVIYAATLVFLIYELSKSLFLKEKFVFIFFCAVLFSIPFGWENSLSGFQSAFYFLILFSFVSIWSTSNGIPFKKLWWVGVASGILAFLSLASGSITLLTCSLVSLIKYLQSNKKNRSYLISVIIFLVIGLYCIYLTPEIPSHQQFRAQNFGEIFTAVLKISSWPIENWEYGFLLTQFPILFLLFSIYKRKKFESYELFLLGLIIWMAGQYLAMAYGRASAALAPRYLDIFSIGLLINLAASFNFFKNEKYKFNKTIGIVFYLWMIFIGYKLINMIPAISNQLNYKSERSKLGEINVKNFLCTGDIFFLNNGNIPYPSPERLSKLLSDPEIVKFLPGNISVKNTKNPIGLNGEPFCDPGHLSRPFVLKKWIPSSSADDIVGQNVILLNQFIGSDYFRSQLSNIVVFGSFINSENDAGTISLKLRRGDKILYRSGPGISGQFILINSGGPGKYYTTLPKSLDWSILDFSNPDLPEVFNATFIDAGTKWGEWIALGFKK